MSYIDYIENISECITMKVLNVGERVCCVPGCNKLGQHMGKKRKDGSIVRRAKCAKHHSLQYGLGGWEYKQFRKTYCENIDGRLGYKCTTTIIEPEWQLDADHIDGNPSNNTKENIQTLCKCCHVIKTKQEQDWLTPGRKTLKVA
jgi:hypothetical protein